MSFPLPVQEPTDGFDPMEKAFLRQMVIDIYKILPNPEDKFIMLAIHDMGYPQEVVAEMLNTSQVTISIRIKSIKSFLRKHPIMSNMK